MFGFQRFLADPRTWVRLGRDGRTVCEGVGRSLWFRRAGATLVAVPLGLRECVFRGAEAVAGVHGLTASGRVIWRVSDPETAAARLDFRVDRNGDPVGDALGQIDSYVRSELQAALRSFESPSPDPGSVARASYGALRSSTLLAALGVEVLAVQVESLDGLPSTSVADLLASRLPP